MAGSDRPTAFGRAGLALILGVLLGVAADVRAQEVTAPPPSVDTGDERLPSDRIMAVVDDHVLLESEWREQVAVLAGQQQIDPGDPGFEELSERVFDQLVQDLVIVSAAERDTMVEVAQEEVIQVADEEIAQIRERFPSEESFLRELSRSQWGSLAAYRADIQDRKRRELLGQRFLEIHSQDIQPQPVSDAEVREYWEANKETFSQRPEAIRFEEIALVIEPSEEARENARERAERVVEEIESGRDFAAVARQFSDDASTREQGGDLGWFSRGRMVAPFEAAAFDAEIGELVGPIETPFGYHVLQVLAERGEERRARHVLVGFERGAEDVARARARAEAIRDSIAAGADVDRLQAELMPGDSLGGEPIELAPSQLPAPYGRAIRGLEPGQAAVVDLSSSPGLPTFNVVVFQGTTGGGEVTFEELAPRLRRQLEQNTAQERFVERLEEEIYVDVRVTPEEALAGAG